VLDEIAEASKALSAALDSSDAVGAAAYTLEVSSRGVGRPLELPRHWRRNAGRLVAVTLSDGDTITGRIVGSDAETVQLEVDGSVRELDLATVSKALVQVELNRPKSKIETDVGEEA
jgi:ribosome maturation factor RimP